MAHSWMLQPRCSCPFSRSSTLVAIAFLPILALVMLPPSAHSEGKPVVRQPPPSAEVIKKLPADGGPEFNRLVFEKSPYLLQHARNPVDWRPWGDEAFAAAEKAGKPVFLSVGYATCHWCHVMEHESFEDPAVAKELNDKFICIKVDREEMPHVDQVYMSVTQGITGSGGWPMSVMMTSDRKPFFAGTYFPKESFMGILSNVTRLWKTEREKLVSYADDMTNRLQEIAKGAAMGDLPTREVLDKAFEFYEQGYDAVHGGIINPPKFAPKFPTPPTYSFLLRYWKQTGNERALEIVENSLTKMRFGGVYDQLGYGVHRYSTDREWLVPHFEKMLYDQALLAIANIEAYQATGKASFKKTAEEIFTYVLRDMRAPEGGFYCAEDADSEGEEGKFYVWNPTQVKTILGDEEAALYMSVFNITDKGNFLDEATGKLTGMSIPHLAKPLEEMAKEKEIELVALRERLEKSRAKLFAEREKRIHPFKDDKILTDWNGLMIAALAQGGVAFGEKKYTEAAEKAAQFVLKTLRDKDGRLLKRYRDGEAGLPSHLEDYAYFLWGLVELYEASFDPQYLSEAKALADTLIKHFWDKNVGGFFMTADDGEKLIVRSKEVYDGALPSGNSVATLNLLRLARLTGVTEYEKRAHDTIKAFAKDLTERPDGYAVMMQAIDFLTSDTREIVVAGKTGSPDTQAMLQAIQQRFDPNKVVLFKPSGPEGEVLSKVVDYVKNHSDNEGKANVYVCRNFACQLPTTDLTKVMELIEMK